MKLIVEIERKDDKIEKHICNDFPIINGDFTTLFKEEFKRHSIRTETIKEIKYYFKK